MLAIQLKLVFFNRDDPIQLLAATQHGQKIVLNFVGLLHAGHFQLTLHLADTKHQPAAGRVREGRDRLVDVIGHAALRALALEVVPLETVQAREKLVLVHHRSPLDCIRPLPPCA